MKKLLFLISSSLSLLALQSHTLTASEEDCCPSTNCAPQQCCVPPCFVPNEDECCLGIDNSAFYAGILGGANFITTCENDGVKLDFDTGYYVGGVLGYRWCFGLRTEFEFTYRYNNLRSFRTFSTTFDTGGSLRRMSYMANAIYDFNFPSLCWPITPYLGAGIGYDHAQITVNDFFVNPEGRKKGLSYQVLAGIGYKVFSYGVIALDYRFHKGREKDLYNHSLGVSGNYFF